MRIYDVTVTISNDLPVYPGDPPIQIERTMSLEKGDIARVSRLSFSTHIGTHVDPPYHFMEGGVPLDRAPLEVFVGPARVVDAGDVASIDAALLETFDLDGASRVLFKTRNSRFWRETNEFMHGCSTNWGAYLTSLKSGAERGEFAAYPAGEMSRWG